MGVKHGCGITFMSSLPDDSVDFVLADPPYSAFPLINDAIRESRRISRNGCAVFMYGEDLAHLNDPPDRIGYWVKPVSTKNTSRTYSRFVEVIAFYGTALRQETHWSNRTGVFTDALITKPRHPHGKPESLIERLLLNHCQPGEEIVDPFAGSGTTGRVAERCGIRCTSVEIDAQWL